MSAYNPYFNYYQQQNQVDADSAVERVRQILAGQQQAQATQQAQSADAAKLDGDNKLLGYVNSGIAGGLAGLANSNPSKSFEFDTLGGYKGAAQGFATGGPIGAAVGGILSQVGQFSKINKNIKNVDTGIEATRFDAFGNPVYDGAAVNSAIDTSNALQGGVNKLQSGASWVNPTTKLFAGLFGTKKRLRNKRRELESGIKSAQDSYNNTVVDFNNQQTAQTQYNQLLNNQSRLNNLYSIGTALY